MGGVVRADGAGELLDLSEDLATTLDLLADRRWCQRVVEQVELTSTAHYEVSRSYQVELTPELLARHVGDRTPSAVRLLLPLGVLPKRPLLGLDLVGPGGTSACLESRRSSSAIEAAHLRDLLDRGGAGQPTSQALPERVLLAVCTAVPGVYEEARRRHGSDVLRGYLDRGLRLPSDGVPLGDHHLAALVHHATAAGRVLAERATDHTHDRSTARDVLVALPFLDPLPASADEAVELVRAYAEGVVEAEAEGLAGFLDALALAGTHVRAMVEVDLRVGTPALVKVREQRSVVLLRRRCIVHEAELADAATYHLRVELQDQSVELGDFEMRDRAGRRVGYPPLDDARRTAELLSISSTAADRPPSAVVRVELRVARDTRLLLLAIGVVAWVGAALAAVVPDDVDRLSVLTLPTALAVAIVQTREQTHLGSSLQRRARMGMLLGAAVLLVVVFTRLVLQPLPS